MGAPPPATTPAGRTARLTATVAAIGVLLALRVPLCPVAAITRHPCPGCGLTRAGMALLRGDLAESARIHPLAPLIVPLMAGILLYGGARYVREGRWPFTEGKAAGRMAVAGIVLWALLMVVWLARFHGAFGGPVPVSLG